MRERFPSVREDGLQFGINKDYGWGLWGKAKEIGGTGQEEYNKGMGHWKQQF